jgi:hypothetical protein
MARGVPHDDTIRAAAIADLMLGCTISEVSRKHAVDRKTVRAWKESYAGDSPLPPAVPQQKQRDLGALVADYLATGLQALTAQARVAGDPQWIAKQPAGELAIFHGVLADKLVRILASLEAGEPIPPPPDGG